MKIKIGIAGLIAGLTIFVSKAQSADLTCQEMPGELHLVSVNGSKRGEEIHLEYELRQANRVKLNEKTMILCSKIEFCVEDKSIKTTFVFHPWTRVGYAAMTAVVNCLQ